MDEGSQQRIITVIVMLKNADHKPPLQKVNVASFFAVKSKGGDQEINSTVGPSYDFQLNGRPIFPISPQCIFVSGSATTFQINTYSQTA